MKVNDGWFNQFQWWISWLMLVHDGNDSWLLVVFHGSRWLMMVDDAQWWFMMVMIGSTDSSQTSASVAGRDPTIRKLVRSWCSQAYKVLTHRHPLTTQQSCNVTSCGLSSCEQPHKDPIDSTMASVSKTFRWLAMTGSKINDVLPR